MPEQTLNDETRYTLLRRLEANPALSQRELARELGISLGKVNYCLKALIDKGYVKANNFRNSKNKRAYLYQLTPAGIAAKGRATKHFLARKQAEYKRLATEIDALRGESRGRAVNQDQRSMLDDLRAKRSQIHAACQQHGARRLRVFGSVARREERPDSDIDFLIDLPRGYDLFAQRLPLQDKLAELCGRRPDLIPEHELSPHIRTAVLQEAVKL